MYWVDTVIATLITGLGWRIYIQHHTMGGYEQALPTLLLSILKETYLKFCRSLYRS